MNANGIKKPVPRNGHTWTVAIFARISGCTDQKTESLDDQIDHSKAEVERRYVGPIEYIIISATGKGESLDRPELTKIEALLVSGKLDVFISEDLGRLVRGGEAVRLIGVGVDNGTRVILPNDGIDTADGLWEKDALAASAEHVAHNTHSSNRLKYKLMNRFEKFGGAPARPIAGYIAPLRTSYGEWTKDSLATPIIQSGLELLRQSLNGQTVADHLNTVSYNGEIGFPTGPYRRTRKQWTAAMALAFYRNRLLGGTPQRGAKHTVKKNATGRRISVRNPAGPRYFRAPHLAHIDLDAQDEVIARLKNKNARVGRRLIDGQDPRSGVCRKRTLFPSQLSRCYYCGHFHLWGGNGITENLMCGNSRE